MNDNNRTGAFIILINMNEVKRGLLTSSLQCYQVDSQHL